MKKITYGLLTVFLLLFSTLFYLPKVSALESGRWTKSGEYYNFINSNNNYSITRDDFSDYVFEYKVNSGNWKILGLNNGDILSNNVVVANSYIIRTILINNTEIVKATSGMYGQSEELFMRYKKIVSDNPNPENPDPEQPAPELDFTLNEDGYYYFTKSANQNADTQVNITDINNKIVEYRVKENDTVHVDWKVLNVNSNTRLAYRNISAGYNSYTKLIVIEGGIEREIATASITRDPIRNEQLQVRYKDVDDSVITTHHDLPSTRGSIFDDKMEMGSVKFLVDGNKLTTIISYDGAAYYMKHTFAPSTDMNIFKDTNEVYYYTYGGEKFILINQGSESMFTSKNVKKQTFIPYTIWNLNTNELNHISRFNTYLYTKMEGGNNAYAYFYVDDFVIDNLLSVSLSYKFRYVNIIGGYSDYEQRFQTLEKDVTTDTNLMTWQLKAMAATTVATYIGLQFPVVRIPALLIGTAAILYIDSTIDHSMFSFGNINQIDEANITPALRQEINNGLLKHNIELNPDKKVFKLHLGQFDKAFTKGIDFDDEYSVVDGQKGINIIQFTYETDGRLYTISGDNINVELEEGTGTDGNGNNNTPGNLLKDIWNWIKLQFTKNPAISWTVAIFLFLLFGLPIITKVKKNVKDFRK